jgi:hypothetical protein
VFEKETIAGGMRKASAHAVSGVLDFEFVARTERAKTQQRVRHDQTADACTYDTHVRRRALGCSFRRHVYPSHHGSALEVFGGR